ncbi:MAG: hypothetical protein ACREDU_12595 [Methylocella sp.]
MRQTVRIFIAAIILAPILAAFLLIGFPAHAITGEDSRPLRDPRVGSRIDRAVKDACRHEAPGSIERSICVAENRKNAYRAAADTARNDTPDVRFGIR